MHLLLRRSQNYPKWFSFFLAHHSIISGSMKHHLHEFWWETDADTPEAQARCLCLQREVAQIKSNIGPPAEKRGSISSCCKHIHETPDLRLFSCHLCLRAEKYERGKNQTSNGDERGSIESWLWQSLIAGERCCRGNRFIPAPSQSRVIPQAAGFLDILPLKCKHGPMPIALRPQTEQTPGKRL